ncbi:MAG: hypothetical protein Q8K91_12885 [Hylemonella sp.]|nr:hypothetical protein [Hylemonella sp.]MDP1938094.1 hypothetical protein [Hylemonella sp.]
MSSNLLWGIVIALAVAALYRAYRKEQARLALRERLKQPVQTVHASELEALDDIQICRYLMRGEDWDGARQALQKVAYGIKREDAEAQREFKQLMTDFAAQDPLVSSVGKTLLELVRQEPGVRQTELYKHLPGIGVEEARYALYFMEQLQLIERKKSGNSYKIFEARPIIEA